MLSQCRPHARQAKATYEIVVIPHVQEHGWSACAPSHHETRKVCNLQLRLYIDSSIDDKAAEGPEESERNEGETPASIIGGICEHKQHDCSSNIRRHCVQICLHSVVSQSRYDLRQEQGNTLKWNTETYLDAKDGVGSGLLEDLSSIAEVELLVHDSRAVDLDPVERQFLLLLGQELGVSRGVRQKKERNGREEYSQAAFQHE